MKSVALVLLITFVPVLCKENLQELEKYLKDPEFIAIVKRLGLDESDIPSSLSDSSANPAAAGVQSHDSGDGSCSKKYNANTIIQTKISLNKGATFLSSEHNVLDAEHCAQKCCETDGCDVSVYQDKEKRACYLFDCKSDTNVNKCEFSTHSGYYAIFVTKSSVGAPSRKSAPEETDLSDLKSSRTQNPVSSTVKPTTVSYHPHSVGNGGACVEDLNCEDIHAECTARTCQCRAGYLEKHGQCRKQCGEKEFRCMEPGTAVAGPDCIPRSQFCDGQAQCGDGSDEINCPTTDAPRWNWPPAPTRLHQAMKAKAQPPTLTPQPPHAGQGIDSPPEVPHHYSPSQSEGQPIGYHEGKVEGEDSSASDLESMSALHRQHDSHDDSEFPHRVASVEMPEKSASVALPDAGAQDVSHKQDSKPQPYNTEEAGSAKQPENAHKSSTDVDDPEMYSHRLELELKANFDPSKSADENGVPSKKLPLLVDRGKEKTQQEAASATPLAKAVQNSKDALDTESDLDEAPQGMQQNGRIQYAEGKVYAPTKALKPHNSQSSSGSNDVSDRPSHPDGKKQASNNQMQSQLDGKGSKDQYGRFKPQSHTPPKTMDGNTYSPQGGANRGNYGMAQQAQKSFLPLDEDSGAYLPKHSDSHPPQSHSSSSYMPGSQGGKGMLGGRPDLANDAHSGRFRPQGGRLQSQSGGRLGGFDFYPSQQTPFRPTHPHPPLQSRPAYQSAHPSRPAYQSAQQSGPAYQTPYKSQFPSYQDPNDNRYLGVNYDYGDYEPYFGDQDYQPSSQRLRPLSASGFQYPGSQRGHSGSAGASHKDGQESSGGTRHDKLDSAGLGAGSVETPGKGKSADPASSSQTAKPQGAAQTDTDQDGKDAVAVVTGNSDASKPDVPQGTSGTDDDDKGTSSADSHTDSKDDNKGSSKDNSKNGDTKDKETSPAPAVTKKPEKGANATGNTAAPAVAGPGLGVSQEESADFVEKMSLIEAYTTKGPIIALSLGLCFTVILLVFVGCRLRNVRRRLLKGRPLHSNEADYLINGMYL